MGFTLGLIAASLAVVTMSAGVPAARAVGPTTHYVAATGTVGAGTSCASPGYVGTTHSAIAAAVAAAAQGDTVYLCGGTYQIGSTITVDKSITLAGAGVAQSILDGGSTTRIMATTNSAIPSLFSVTVSGLQFRNGKTTGSVLRGGAINNALNVTLYVNDALFRNNRADEHGGAINVGLWGQSGVGSGSLHIARSTFLNNRASAQGGAIFDGRFASAISTVVNSTFLGNHADSEGGAIAGGRGLMVTSSTFINNTSSNGSAVRRTGITGSLVVVPNGTGTGCSFHTDPFAWVTVSANVSNAGNCLSGATAPVTVDSTATSFLAPWGGPTPTVRISATSSALNVVPAASCPATDQRGVTRAVGDGTCDAGAFEFTASPPGLAPERSSTGMIQGIPLEGSITNGFVTTGLTAPTFRIATEVTADLPAGLTLASGTGAATGTPSATSATGSTYVITAEGTNGAIASAQVTVSNCILPLVSGAYRIDSRNDLEVFRQGFCGLSSRYVQEAHIAWNAAWSGVGTNGTRFTGTYDGGGHAITGLTMSNNSGYAAFIAYASGATVSALQLEAIVNGGERSAVVVGDGTTTNLVDVHASGTITRPSSATSSSCVGGLAGRLATNSLVLRSSFTGTVSVSAGASTGGLVGCVVSSRVERSTADVTVNGVSDVGGLVGLLQQSEMTDSYATGAAIATTDRLGGLVGYADRDSADVGQVAVTRSYAATTLSAPQRVGGLVGRAATSGVSASFWQAGLVGADGRDAIGEVTPLPGLAATPLANLQQHAFFSAAGWNIANGWEAANTSSNAWGICSGTGTPFLLWEFTNLTCPVVGGTIVLSPALEAMIRQPVTTTPVNPEPPTTPTPTTPTPTTTTPPQAEVAVPELPAGASAVEVGGVRQDVALTWQTSTEVVGRVGDLDVRIRFGGTLLGARSPGVVAPGSTAVVMLTGALPGSDVTITLFSSPTDLGTMDVGADGSLDEGLIIPADARTGDHHLRLQATNAAGEAVTVWLALTIEAPAMMLPATGGDTGLVTLAWWLLLGGLACLALVLRGRRLTSGRLT